MRLTLRTLLAYLDDILEPEDRQSLSEKIEESEFAKTLEKRCGDVVARDRLGAPQVRGSGMARDPNTVAEYLDNTMAPEQIQEFEKVCLESDIHLAEVAACHHILTMVLGEPAPVDPASRERMYRLNEGTVMRIDSVTDQLPEESAPTAEPTAEATAEPTAEATTKPTAEATALREATATTAAVAERSEAEIDQQPTPESPEPAVPDYLREGRRSPASSILWTFLLGLLVAGGLIMLLDPDFRSMLAMNDPSTKDPTADAMKAGGDEQPAPGADVGGGAAVADGGAAPLVGPNNGAGGAQVETPGSSIIDPPGIDPPAIDPVADPLLPRGTTPDPGGDVSTPPDGGAIPPVTDTGEPPSIDPGADDTPPPGDDTTDGASSDPPVTDDGLPMVDPGGAEVGPTAGSPPPDQVAAVDPPDEGVGPLLPGTGSDAVIPGVQPETTKPAVVGRLLSQNEVLLGTKSTRDTLERLPARAVLSVGDKLLVLPTFRPMISVAATTLELDGPAMIELVGIDADGVPEIKVQYGRVIVRSLSMPNASLRLRMGDHEGMASFNDSDSSFAIEVRTYRPPGTDPRTIPSRHAVDLYAASGRIKWSADGREETITSPVRRVLTPHPAEDLSGGGALPQWLSESVVSPLDQRAVPWIEQGVRAGRSVKLSLSELSEHRRSEIQRLAYRCCAQIGYFDPLVSALNDPDMRPRWDLYIGELNTAVANDSELAADLYKTLEKMRGESAFDLFRMFWGYSRDGLTRGGEARELVGFLDHDDLDYRVLSFWNLQLLTGLGLNYRPEYTKLRRSQSVQRWAKLADKDEIVPQGSAPDDAESGS